MKSHKEIKRSMARVISAVVSITFFCENLVLAGDISQVTPETPGAVFNYQNMTASSPLEYEANQLELANKIAIAEKIREQGQSGAEETPVVIADEDRTGISIIDANSIRSFSEEGDLSEVILGEDLDTILRFSGGEISTISNGEGLLDGIKIDGSGNIEKAKLTKADGEEYFFDGGNLKSFTQGKNTEIFLDKDGGLQSVLNRETGERFLLLDTGGPKEDENKTFVSEKTNARYFYSKGFLKEVRDAKGIVVSCEYDGSGRAKKMTVECEKETIHSYDTEYTEEGSVLTDENGNRKYFDLNNKPVTYITSAGDIYGYEQLPDGSGTVCELQVKATEAGEKVFLKKGAVEKIEFADLSVARDIARDEEGNVTGFTMYGPGYREIKVAGDRTEAVLAGGEKLVYDKGILEKIITAYGETSFKTCGVGPINTALIGKPKIDANKDGIDIYRLKEFLPENALSIIPNISSGCVKPSYFKDCFRTADYSNYSLATIPLKLKSGAGNDAFKTCSAENGYAKINFNIPGAKAGEAVADISGALTAAGAAAETIDLSRATVKFYVKKDGPIATNSVLPLKFSVIARSQTNGITSEYQAAASATPLDDWLCIELPITEAAKKYNGSGFNPYAVTQISLKAANADGKSWYSGCLDLKYEIKDAGQDVFIPSVPRKVSYSYYPPDKPAEKRVLVKVSELGEYMRAKGFAFGMNGAYAERMRRIKEIVRKNSSGGETVVREVLDNDGKVRSSTNASGMTICYDDSGRIDLVKEPSGEVYIDHEYDAAGELVNARMAGARGRLDAAAKASEAALEEKVGSLLKELDMKKREAEARLESALNGQINIFDAEMARLEGERIRTVITYDENRRVKFAETYEVPGVVYKMNETSERKREFIESVNGERARLNGAFSSEADKLFCQRDIALRDIGRQKNELLSGILKQELIPVLNYLYRKTLGRDPSRSEIEGETAVVTAGYMIDAKALKQKISLTAENARNIIFRNNVRGAVLELLGAYAKAGAPGKAAILKTLNMSGEACVNISERHLAETAAWLERQDAHFGKSAFIALSRMLGENARNVPLEELAVKALAADILAGASNPFRDGSMKISLFAQGKILGYYGVATTAAVLGYSDITRLKGAFMTLIGNDHYITVRAASDAEVVYWEPNAGSGGELFTVSRADFERTWKGYVITTSAVDAKKIVPAERTKKIRGAFFWVIIPVICSVASAIATATVAAVAAICAAAVTALTAAVSACAAIIAEAVTAITAGLVSLGEAALGFAASKLGGLAGAAFGKLAGGLSAAALVENAAVTAAGFGVSCGVNTALNAAGVDPVISGIISSVITGGVTGCLAANATIAGALKSAVTCGIKTAALAVGQYFDLPPAIRDITASAGMALSGMIDAKVTLGEAVRMVRDTAVSQAVMAGVELMASAGKISALSSSIVMNAFSGAFSGFLSRPDNRLDGAMTGAFRNITRSVVRAASMGIYVPFKAEWNEDPYFAAENFMELRTLIAENGLNRTLELYMAGIFTADAARAITERGGVADLMSGGAEVVMENGEALKKIRFGDNYALYVSYGKNDIKGVDIDNVKERGTFAIDKRSGAIKLMDGTIERERNGEKYLYKVSEGIVVLGIRAGNDGQTFEMACIDKETGRKISRTAAPDEKEVFGEPYAQTVRAAKTENGQGYTYWFNSVPSADITGSAGDGIAGKEEEDKRYILANGINNNNALGMPGYFYGLMLEISAAEKGNVNYTTIPLYNGIYGKVQKESFKNVVDDSGGLMYNLINRGYINAEGVVQEKFWALKGSGELELSVIFAGREQAVYDILYRSADHHWKDLRSWSMDAVTNLNEQTGRISAGLSETIGTAGSNEMVAVCYSGGGDPMIQALNLDPGRDVKSLIMVGTPVALGGRHITNTNVKTVVNIFGELDILKPRVAAETFAESFCVENEFNIVIKDCTHVDYFYDPTEASSNDNFKRQATKFIAAVASRANDAKALYYFLSNNGRNTKDGFYVNVKEVQYE